MEELHWDVPSVETLAEMEIKGNEMGQREKLFSAAVATVASALKLEWLLKEV